MKTILTFIIGIIMILMQIIERGKGSLIESFFGWVGLSKVFDFVALYFPFLLGACVAMLILIWVKKWQWALIVGAIITVLLWQPSLSAVFFP